MTITNDSISQVYDRLSTARQDLFAAHDEADKALNTHNWKRAEIIVTTPPKELGANDEQRQAKLSELLAPEAKTLSEAQAKERAMRLAYELATDNVRRTDALLQLLTANAVRTIAPTDGPAETLVEF